MHSNASIDAGSLTCSIYKVYIVASKAPNQNSVHSSRLSLTGKYFFSSRSSRSSAGGHPCMAASPSHHMTIPAHFSSRHQPIFALAGRPCIASVVQSVRLTAQLALSSWVPSSGILQRCGKSSDSGVQRVGVSSDGASDAAQFLGLPVEFLYRPTATQRLFLGGIALVEMLRLSSSWSTRRRMRHVIL